VIDEEVGYITDIGNIEFRHKKIDSMKAILAEGYDAVFVGSGAPRGRELDVPGRKEATDNIHVGLDWLSSVSFGHTTRSQARDRAGRRQHRHGLLPHRPPSRRRGRQGDRSIRLRRDESVALGEGRRDGEDIPILNMLVPKEVKHDNGKIKACCSRR